MRVGYCDGELLLVVQDDCVVMGELSPERGAAAWVSMQRPPCDPIALLATVSGGPERLGDLAIACVSGDDLVVVSRGDLSALVRLTDSSEQVVTGRDAATWSELVVPVARVQSVELRGERDVATDPAQVTLAGGVVRAGVAELVFAQAPVAALVDQPEPEPESEPATALPPEVDPPPRRADPTIVEPAPDLPLPEQDAGLSVLGWDPEQPEEPEEPEEPDPSAPPEDSGETLSAPDDSYDSLWGATVSRVPEDAAIRLGPEAHEQPASAGTPGLITGVPGASGTPSAPPAPGSPSDVPGGDHDGLTVARSALRNLVAPPSSRAEPRAVVEWHLLLSTGAAVPVDRPVVLGRAPRSLNTLSTQVPRLVTVDSPHGYVSSTHLEVRVEDGSLVVKDVSTNGTLLSRPGVETERLPHATEVPVTDGCRLDLGDSFGITVQRVGEP